MLLKEFALYGVSLYLIVHTLVDVYYNCKATIEIAAQVF